MLIIYSKTCKQELDSEENEKEPLWEIPEVKVCCRITQYVLTTILGRQLFFIYTEEEPYVPTSFYRYDGKTKIH